MKDEDPTFSVYLSQPVKNEFALVIVTHEKKDDSFVSEFFAFVHSPKPQRFAMKYYQKGAAFLEQAFDYTIEVVRDDTLASAQAELDGYMLAKYEQTQDPYYLGKFFELKKIPQRRLLAYHVQGLCNDQFRYIVDESLCDALRKYLMAILDVPPIQKIRHK